MSIIRYSDYFEERIVRPEFRKEFVSLFDGWLGAEKLGALDAVTEADWAKFNMLHRLIHHTFPMALVQHDSQTVRVVSDIDATLASYTESMNKESAQFSSYVIPKLGCLLTEDWDFTYIIWHRGNGAVETLKPLIEQVGLNHFRDESSE